MVKVTTGFIEVYRPSGENLENMQRIVHEKPETHTKVIQKVKSNDVQNTVNNYHCGDNLEFINMKNNDRIFTERNIPKILNNNKAIFDTDCFTDSSSSLDSFSSSSGSDEDHDLVDFSQTFDETSMQKMRNKIENNSFTETNLTRSFSSAALSQSFTSSNISMLNSPKLTRRNLSKPKKGKQKAYTADDLRLQLPSSYLRYGGSEIDLRASHQNTADEDNLHKINLPLLSAPTTPTSEEDVLYKRNSYLLSPRVKRKQIDITSSAAYKEIYASNLRLYSAVLAKQIASTGQVGREMNEIRRHKMKQKALNSSLTDSMFHRSQSVNQIDKLTSQTDSYKSESTGIVLTDRIRGKDHGESEIVDQKEPTTTTATTNPDQPIFNRTLSTPIVMLSSATEQEEIQSEGNDEHYARGRSYSALEPRNIKKVTGNNPTNIRHRTSTLDKMSPRKRAATLRSETLRQKLDSLDIAMNEADKFIDKVKSIGNS